MSTKSGHAHYTPAARYDLRGFSGAPCVIGGVIAGVITHQLCRTLPDGSEASESKPSLDTVFALPIALLASSEVASARMTAYEPNRAHCSSPRISTSRLPVSGRQFVGREEELRALDTAWDDPRTNVVTVVAWGGAGKSSLVNRWLSSLEQNDFRGAQQVFGWSFYRAGTGEHIPSGDQFIDTALREFGDANPTIGTPVEKGQRLAQLVKRQRTLLVLDGLEPLQFPPGPNAGRIKDDAVSALLRELASQNPGLCVVTTRQSVADLASRESGGVRRIDLKRLSSDAGAELLQQLGVRGTEEQRREACDRLEGHALTLTLLGTYLREAWRGDVAMSHHVSLLDKNAEGGGQAHSVIASYEQWFNTHHRLGEIALLRLIGLFSGPADDVAISALLAPPPIPGITDVLQNLTIPQRRELVQRLRDTALLAEADMPIDETLDAHPLVREYFGQQLKIKYPRAWRDGNERLFEFHAHHSKEFPETIDEMIPLYVAIAHGCAAGRYDEACLQVYWRRIQRENEFYAVKKLGMLNADVAALGQFFERQWDRPAPSLSERALSIVLDEAGEALHALGRLEESQSVMQLLLATSHRSGKKRDSVKAAITISELSLTMGRITDAISLGELSVTYADAHSGPFHRQVSRVALADALHQAGRYKEARNWFEQAEAIEKERRPKRPLLASVQGYAYCDYLLGQKAHQEALDRAKIALEWAKQDGMLLAIALNQVTIGRALANDPGAFAKAEEWFEWSVAGLRRAGVESCISRGLLARAAYRRESGMLASSRCDIVDAAEIASRGEMKLIAIDCHLQLALLSLLECDLISSISHTKAAANLIRRTGYVRREIDIQQLNEAVGRSE